MSVNDGNVIGASTIILCYSVFGDDDDDYDEDGDDDDDGNDDQRRLLFIFRDTKLSLSTREYKQRA